MTEKTIFLVGDWRIAMNASGTWSTEIAWLTVIAYFLWIRLIHLRSIAYPMIKYQ